MKILCQKHLGGLRPADDASLESLNKLKHGELVTVEVKRPRNAAHHRLYWALISLVWENLDQERYPSAEDLHAAVKIAAGLRTRIVLPSGEIGFIPGSIAFHKMSQADFDAFYNTVCDLMSKHFLPGVTSDELKREVQQMIGAA